MIDLGPGIVGLVEGPRDSEARNCRSHGTDRCVQGRGIYPLAGGFRVSSGDTKVQEISMSVRGLI